MDTDHREKEKERLWMTKQVHIKGHRLHHQRAEKLTCSPGCGTSCVRMAAGSWARAVWPGLCFLQPLSYIYDHREEMLTLPGLWIKKGKDQIYQAGSNNNNSAIYTQLTDEILFGCVCSRCAGARFDLLWQPKYKKHWWIHQLELIHCGLTRYRFSYANERVLGKHRWTQYPATNNKIRNRIKINVLIFQAGYCSCD